MNTVGVTLARALSFSRNEITSRLASDELPASEVIDDDTKAATG
jgi:hypothetical protein